MKQIAAITQFLLGLNLVPAESLESWVEDPVIVPSGKNSGNAMVLYRQKYDAVISITGYPHQTQPVENLLGNLAAWLLTHGNGSDELIQPRTEVDVIDITIEFEEDVFAVVDPAGPIDFNGQRYRIDDAAADIAETGEVTT